MNLHNKYTAKHLKTNKNPKRDKDLTATILYWSDRQNKSKLDTSKP